MKKHPKTHIAKMTPKKYLRHMYSLIHTYMKKQKGFTLIELMVVMAIIAILATAGLSAYTGYIKKARDATRIEDLRTINTIVMGMMARTGSAPTNVYTIRDEIMAMNNGQVIKDPLDSGGVGKSVCMNSSPSSTATTLCEYLYIVCDNGAGYALGISFESKSNQQMYANDSFIEQGSGLTGSYRAYGSATDDLYSIGSCKYYLNNTGAGTNKLRYGYTKIPTNTGAEPATVPE